MSTLLNCWIQLNILHSQNLIVLGHFRFTLLYWFSYQNVHTDNDYLVACQLPVSEKSFYASSFHEIIAIFSVCSYHISHSGSDHNSCPKKASMVRPITTTNIMFMHRYVHDNFFCTARSGTLQDFRWTKYDAHLFRSKLVVSLTSVGSTIRVQLLIMILHGSKNRVHRVFKDSPQPFDLYVFRAEYIVNPARTAPKVVHRMRSRVHACS